jgi:hypothetical protein
MGKIIRGKDEAKTRPGIIETVSKVVTKMRGDSMSDKGWKAIAIVGVWGSIAIMFAITGEINQGVASLAATATLVIALFL